MIRLSSMHGVTASDIPCTEEGVVIRMWNYVLWHLPKFKTVIAIHLFYCFIALEASVVLVKVFILLWVSWPVCLRYSSTQT